MTIGIRVQMVGVENLLAAYQRVNPKANPEIFGRTLKRIALETQELAANNLIRGGSQAAVSGKLTSRTGTGRRSIGVDFGSLPLSASVGSHLKYMAVHETGGTFSVPSHQVAEHTRTVVFGRKVAPFKVPSFTRGGHSATFPARPWLGPAIDRMVPTRAEEILRQEIEGEL